LIKKELKKIKNKRVTRGVFKYPVKISDETYLNSIFQFDGFENFCKKKLTQDEILIELNKTKGKNINLNKLNNELFIINKEIDKNEIKNIFKKKNDEIEESSLTERIINYFIEKNFFSIELKIKKIDQSNKKGKKIFSDSEDNLLLMGLKKFDTNFLKIHGILIK
jgi:hypothetical protein